MKQQISIKLDDKVYEIEPDQAIDISIPVHFGEQQLRAFSASPATATPFNTKGFTASVNAGAGYNCEMFSFSAHLHGTHTECVGHISKQRHVVQTTTGYPGLLMALLITIKPISAFSSEEGYDPAFDKDDQVITQQALQKAFEQHSVDSYSALIIRTLPNDADKPTRDYDQFIPAFFTNQAMQAIAQAGFAHLLVDMPSVDRLNDDGKLSNHHIFWGVEQGSNDVPEASAKTITELIFVPDEITDGAYLLDLNIGNIHSDAVPSRPVLYEMKPV